MKSWEKIKRYLTQRKMLKTDVFLLLVFLLALAAVWEWRDWYNILPKREIELVNPYLAQADTRGNVYIIDEERSRVIKLNTEKKAEYILKSNEKEADTFWYAEDLAFDEQGRTYLLDASWDETGSAVGRECILVYDKYGHYEDTVLDIAYENEWVNKHKLFALTFWENALYYVKSQQEGFSLFRLSLTDGVSEEVMFCAYEDAFDLIQDYALDYEARTIYAIDKRGRIIKGDREGTEVLYNTAEDSAYVGKTAFYRLAVGSDNTIYVTDIRSNRIYRFKEGQESLQVYEAGVQVLSITAACKADGSTLLGIWQDGGITVREAGMTSGETDYAFEKSGGYLLRETGYQLALLCMLLAGIWIFLRVIIILSGIRLSTVQKSGILAAGTAAVVGIIIVSQLLEQFSAVYREELVSKLYALAYTTSGIIDGDSLERIQTCEDYMDDDYRQLMETMELTLNREDSSIKEMYGNILRLESGQGYAMAYLDNSIGTYYPLDEAETEELSYIYETRNSVRNDGKDDVTGSYIYVRVPVFTSSGEVAGVVEIGKTSEVITGKIEDMRKSVMLNLLVVVLIVLFLFGEVLSFFDLKTKYRKEKTEKGTAMPMHLLRCCVFITYIAFNIASSFLPVYAAGFVTDALGIPRELAASLPITLNMVFIGLMSLFCAKLLRRFSFRSVAAVSALISMTGDLLLFSGESYGLLVVGLILNGIGMGLISNSLNIFIAETDDGNDRQEGFSLLNAGSLSGINCGMMLGASLAGAVGQRTVFACSASAWLLVSILFAIMGKYVSKVRETQEKKTDSKAFWTSRGVVPYMLLIQVPYVIINSFVFYYVPIYGDAMGFSENTVCLFLMLNSLCSVYLSVGITNFMVRKFAHKSIYLSSLLAFAALLLFGWNSSVPMLVVVLLLLGIAGSFGGAVRQLYFIEMPGVEEYGEDSAMGIYNFVDNLGESAGPVLFGSIMAGPSLLPGLAGFVVVSGVMNGVYALLFRTRKKGERSN